MDAGQWITNIFTLCFLLMGGSLAFGSYKLMQKRLAEDEKQTDLLRAIARHLTIEVREQIESEIDEGWVDDLVKALRKRGSEQVRDHITDEVRASIMRDIRRNQPGS